MIAVVDYGAGNLRSVTKALAALGADVQTVSDPGRLLEATAVLLPGVGAGGAAMRALEAAGLVVPIRQFVASGRPFLGVCLGLQLLFTLTEEDGGYPCLDLLQGTVRRLPAGQKVPHMGWNTVHQRYHHPLLEGVPDGTYFYFVHSYYADPVDREVVLGETEYGVTFPSIIARGNILATQFHPEKSGRWGLQIYANFLELVLRHEGRTSSPQSVASGPGLVDRA